MKHVPESLSQLCVGGKKKCVLEGLAPLHRFVAISETWPSCALKSWHLFNRFYRFFTIRRFRFILVFR